MNQQQPKSSHLLVRIKDTILKKIDKKAEAEGHNRSSYVRYLIAKDLGLVKNADDKN